MAKDPRIEYCGGLPFSMWSMRILVLGFFTKNIYLVNSTGNTEIGNVLIKHDFKWKNPKTTLQNNLDPE